MSKQIPAYVYGQEIISKDKEKEQDVDKNTEQVKTCKH